jgi:hypothetical protein
MMVTEEEENQPICKVRAKTNASRTRTSKNKQNATTIMQDKKLRSLLVDADDIKSVEHFTYWKDDLYVVVS